MKWKILLPAAALLVAAVAAIPVPASDSASIGPHVWSTTITRRVARGPERRRGA